MEVVGDATHVKNRNTRTRGNKKRFLLLRSLELILFHPLLKIIRVSFLLFFSSFFRRRDKRKKRFDRRARFVLGASHRDNSSFIARKVVDRAQYRVSSGVETTTEIDHADYRIITVIRLLERYVNSTFTGSPLPPTSE